MKKCPWGIMVVIAAIVLTAGVGLAQEKEPKKTRRVMSGLSGEVSAISKDFIAIVYRRDETGGSEEEMAFPVAKDVVVEHKRSLSEIGIGDLVDVEFEETTEETKEGSRSSRVVKVVRFVRAAPKPVETSVLGAEGSTDEETAEE